MLPEAFWAMLCMWRVKFMILLSMFNALSLPSSFQSLSLYCPFERNIQQHCHRMFFLEKWKIWHWVHKTELDIFFKNRHQECIITKDHLIPTQNVQFKWEAADCCSATPSRWWTSLTRFYITTRKFPVCYDKVFLPHHQNLTCLVHKTAPTLIIVYANGGMLHTSVAGSQQYIIK
jgi:hypothetical protein